MIKRLVVMIVVVGWLLATSFMLSDANIVEINGQQMKYLLADSQSERSKGLSGKTDLPKDEVMLFVFDDEGKHGIWMKDMKFPIDIIWLDGDKRVTWIQEDVDPSTYPTVFYPTKPSKYVIEANAGFVETIGLQNGDQVSFDISD